jgi:hypothetical protein
MYSFPWVLTPEIAENFGQRKQWVTTGVCPFGAQVRMRVGIRLKPLSSTNISVAFSRRAFF